MFFLFEEIPELKTRIIQQLTAFQKEVNPGQLIEIIKTLNPKSFTGKVHARNLPKMKRDDIDSQDEVKG